MPDPSFSAEPLADTELHLRKFQKELAAGTVALLLLSTMADTQEALYGYQIAKRLESSSSDSGDAIGGKQSALYPVLRNLEASGLLISSIEPSVAGPPRRYYQITKLGRAVHAQWLSHWIRTRNFVDQMLHISANGASR